MHLLLRFAFNRFNVIQGSSVEHKQLRLVIFSPAEYVRAFPITMCLSPVHLSVSQSVRPSVRLFSKPFCS